MPSATTKTPDENKSPGKDNEKVASVAAEAAAPLFAPQEAPKPAKGKSEPKRKTITVNVNKTSRWRHIQSAGLMFTPNGRSFVEGTLSPETVAELKANTSLTVVETEE